MRATSQVILTATLITVMVATPASAKCWSWQSNCSDGDSGSSRSWQKPNTTTRSFITDDQRRILGDLYYPGTGNRTQIRDKNRSIIGYIESDGTITNTRRQPVAEIDLD